MKSSSFLQRAIFFVLLLVATIPSEVISLASSPTSSAASKASQKSLSAPIKRVAIIGTGVAGLSLAHALENSEDCAKVYTDALRRKNGSTEEEEKDNTSRYGIEVTMFDSRKSLDYKSGSGIQLNGGMAVLQRINPALQRTIANASLPMKSIQSRTKPWFFHNIIDKNNPFQTLFEMNVPQAIQSAGGDVTNNLVVNGETMAYAIMRGALQEILMDQLPSDVSNRAQFGKTLTGIKGGEKEGITCEFSDRSSYGPFDMVIGCDGIKSAVKEYIDTKNISPDPTMREGSKGGSIYSGIRIQYAVQDGKEEDKDVKTTPSHSEFRQYFGDGAYGLKSTYGAGVDKPPANCAFLVFLDDDYIGPFKRKKESQDGDNIVGISSLKEENSNEIDVAENADWTQSMQKADTRQTFIERARKTNVPDIDIGPIAKNADRFFEVGVYFHNPFSLSGWSREVKGSGGRRCVLAGDAAHAMPPFLGQGGNQAVQDAYSLAKAIFEHNANVEMICEDTGDDVKDIGALLRDYERKRWFPTTSITAKSIFLGYLETGYEGPLSKFRDIFFFTMGNIGVAKKVFLDSATPKV